MEATAGHSRLSPDVWKEILSHLPMRWRAMCCRVCKVWQKDFEQPQQGHGDDVLVDYGLGTLCSVLATEGVDEVMRRIHLHYPSGIAEDLGRMDQVRRFVQRHRFAKIETVDGWMQLASQEPDAGWLCKAVSKTKLEGKGKGLVRQAVGKPQDFSMLLDMLKLPAGATFECYSPDGSTIVSACYDGTVRLLDAKTMEVKGTLRGHSDCVTCVAYSPDGKHIASASDDKTVKIWDAVTMEEVCSLKGHSQGVSCVAYSSGGKHIASASDDKTVKIWDAVTMEEVCSLKGHSGRVNCVAYSPDGKHIASGSDDETVKIWDAETKQEVCSLKGHSGQVLSVAYSPDGSQLASAGGYRDNTVKLWDPKTMECKGTLMGHTDSVLSVSYSPDSKSLASASLDKTVKLWDLSGETPVEKGTLTGHNIAVTCVAYSPDGKHIASASDYGTVKIWDAETKLGVCSLNGHLAYVNSVAFSPDLKYVASGSGHSYHSIVSDNSVRIWDASTGEEVGTLTGHFDCVRCVAYSPDGKRIASASEDGTVRIWDAETVRILRGHSASVISVAFSPDSKYVASGSGEYGDGDYGDEYDKSVRIWDASTGEEVGTLKGHSGGVTRVAYSPDGKRIASGSDDATVKIWDAETKQEVCTLGRYVASWQHLDPETKALAARVRYNSYDESAGSSWTGQYLVTAIDYMVYVYRTDSVGEKQGEPLACFRSPATVTTVSCKGTTVAVGCGDGQVSCYMPCWNFFGARVPPTEGHVCRGGCGA